MVFRYIRLNSISRCLGGAALLLFFSCSTVLLNTRLWDTADGWSIALTSLTDGPNFFSLGGGITYEPGKGQRFVWAIITVRNNLSVKRDFSYDACGLDGRNSEFLPVLVDRHMFINALADKVESFAPGEERGRRLVFSYPKDQLPTRLRCGPITLPFPPFRN